MIKKTILNLFFFVLFLTILNGIGLVSAYSFQIPICNPPSINISCIELTSIPSITTAPLNGIMYWKDGYLYLTNETVISYGSINNTYTYNNTIYTNVSYFYSYNLTNGSTLIITQNVTANDSIIRDWVNNKINVTLNNITYYNKNEADAKFVFRTEFDELKNTLSTYSTISNLDSRYGYLLAINGSGIVNGTINSGNEGNFSTIWKVIIIILCVLVVILLFAIIRIMTSF
jgi:hypothetical protein